MRSKGTVYTQRQEEKTVLQAQLKLWQKSRSNWIRRSQTGRRNIATQLSALFSIKRNNGKDYLYDVICSKSTPSSMETGEYHV